MPIRLLLADDHAVFRSGLKALLEAEDDMCIVAEAGDGQEALTQAKQAKPDVIVLDLNMPGLGGARCAELLLADRPKLPIVILTMHDDEYYLQEMFRVGVQAFVLKKSTATELVQAIRAAYRGEQYVDSALTGHVISNYVGRRVAKTPGQLDPLTPREREVCQLLAYGHTNAEIAAKLFISERTVETHRTNLMRKLGVKGRAELVRFAIDSGLMRLE